MRQSFRAVLCAAAALLSGAGTAAAQTPASIDLSALGEGMAQHAPAVAFDGAGYLVVWEEDARVWGAFLDPNGAVSAFLDPNGAVTVQRFVVTPDAEPNAVQGTPAVAAASAGGFLVVWTEDRGAGADVRAARVDPGGSVLDRAGLEVSTVLVGGIPTPAPGPQVAPAVAASGSEFFVVWQDGRGDPAVPQVFGTVVRANGTMPFPDGIVLAPSARPQRSPGVASNGTGYLVAWEEVLLDGTVDIVAARVSTAGTASPAMAISTAPADQLRPAVASNGGGYAVVWNDASSGSWQLVGVRVAEAGVLDPSGVFVAAVDAGAPHAIASDGIGYLVAYERSGAGALAARLGASGAPGAEVGIDAAAVAPGQALAFAWYGRYLEVHRTSVAGVAQLAGAFVVTSERLDVVIQGTGAVVSTPAGIDCGAACSMAYETGTSVTLTTTPGPAFKLAGWSGCGSASGAQCTVTLTGPASVTATFVPALPEAPGVPTYSAIGATSLTVSWAAAQDATGYELERAPDVAGAPGPYALVATGAATSHLDGGLTPNTTYWYRVRATNAAGAGAYGSASSVTTLTAAPGTPTFSAISTTGVTVSWAAPAGGATSYDVERGTSATGPWSAIATGLTTTSHADDGLLAGTTYWYRVKASGAAGSAYSASASTVTLPDAPAAPTCSSVTTTSVTVSWIGVTGAASYRLERGAAATGPFSQVAAGLTATSYDDAALTANGTFWYRVVATNESGDGAPSPASAVTTLTAAPGTPTFSAISTTGVTVSWAAPAGGATSYDVERGTSATGPWSAIATGLTATSHADGGLLAGTTYWYRVKASGTAGSAYSASASTVTLPDAPAAPTFSSVTTTSVTVTWTAVTGATGYKLERAPDDGAGAPGAWTQIAAPTGTTAASTGLSTNTRYWYRVRGTNASGDGPYSAAASVTTLPNAPGAPTFSSITTTSLVVSWTAPVGGAATYDVERGTSATGPWTAIGTGLTATTHSDVGLLAGTTYWYRVRATNADALASAWSTASVPTLPVAPGTPTFSSIAATSVQVSWTAATGATSYKLERAPDDGAGAPGAWTQIATPTGTTATGTGLSANTRYWYRVRATNASGDGAYSAPASVTTLPNGPGTPTFSAITATSLTVSWTAPTGGAASYDLERALADTGPWTPIATGLTATSHADGGLFAGTTYWYRVRATNADGLASAWSTEFVPTLPGAPGTPTFSSIGATSVQVSWTAATGATGYKLERAPDDGAGAPGAWTQIAAPTDATATSGGLSANTRYWYRVRAANASGDGEYSAPASVTTLPEAPGRPTFTNVTTTTLTVSWTAPTGGADRYDLDRALAGAGPWTPIATGTTSTTFDDAGLSPGTTYWYRVRAANAAGGWGAYSSSASVTTLPGAPGEPWFTGVSTVSLTVNWAPVAGATKYKVERALGDASGQPPTEGWIPVATAVSDAYFNDAVDPNTVYWYRVSAGNISGYGDPSPATSVVSLANGPAAPTYSNVTATSLTVSWTVPVGGAKGYAVERATSTSGPWTRVATGLEVLSYDDTGLAAGTTYWYRVGTTSVIESPTWSWSPASTVTTAPAPAPGAPIFANIAMTTLTVSWTAPAGGPWSYAVERSTAIAGPWTRVATALDLLSFDDAGLTAATTYWYRAGATSVGGTTYSWSPVSDVATLPPPPSGAPGAPTFPSVGASSVTVAWTAVTGATGYRLERASDSAGAPGTWVEIAAGSAATYVDGALAPNTRYWYRVRGTNAGGDGPYSPASSAVTLPPPPGAPTFSDVTGTTLTVSWTAPAGGAASYAVERGPSASGPWTRVASALAVLSYDDTGLTAGTTYWYRVGAASAGSTSYSWSPASTVATLPPPPTGAPGAPTFPTIGTSSLTVTWTAAAGATRYELERAPDAAGAPGAWAHIATGTPTTYLDGGLTANTRYWYRVRGSNAGGDGPFSPASSVVTVPNAPGTPTATSVSATSIGLAWTEPAGGAASYDLERTNSASGPWGVVASGPARSYTDAGLSPGTTYWYRVRARNSAGGAGAYSAARTIATLAPAPGAPTYSNVAAMSVTVSWTPAGGAAGYRLERATAGGSFALVAATLGPSYVDLALSPNTTYEYRVLAVNGAGVPGPYSPPTMITTLPGAPGAPAFTSILAASVVVSWTAPAGGAASYDLERAPGAAGPWIPVAVAIAAQSHTDSGLTAQTSYTYRVRARNSAGALGLPSASRSVTTAASAAAPPGTPGAPEFDTIWATAVRVRWAPATDAVQYELERADAVGGPWALVARVTLPGLTDTGRAANRTYWYRVRATNGAGASPTSPVAGVTTAPNAPAAPGFGSVTPSSVTVTWAPPAGGAASYAVERASNAIGPWSQIARDLTALSFADGQVRGNTTYWYRIRASNADGVPGQPSSPASVATPPEPTASPPEAPAAPTFSNVGAGTLWVTWAAVPLATSYTLERAVSSAGPWSVSAATAGTTSIVVGLVANTTYWYRVRASSAGGDGPYSAAASVTTAPNVPGVPTFSGASSTSVVVAWTAPQGGAASYTLQRAPAAVGPWAVVASGIAGTSRSDAGLSANTAYHYRVSAVNAAGVASSYSPSRSVTTSADVTPPPPAPGAPTYGTVTKSWIQVSWSAAAGAVSYELERAPDGAGGPGTFALVAAGIAGTSYTDTGRIANTRYWYRVRAVNAGGRGDPSASTSVTTAPDEPGAPTFQAIGTTSVDVSWTAPAGGAASYVLERAPDLAGPWMVVAFEIPTLGHSDAGLAPSTTYWYRVRATNASGLSGIASSAASVTTAAEGVPLPGAPGPLAFPLVRATWLAVEWDVASDATAYVLERATAADGPWTFLETVADTIFSETGLTANTAYWYRVRGTNESGEGPASTARVVTAPNAPGAPTFANVGSTSVTVQWTAPAGGAASYEVERATSSAGPWTRVGTGVTSLSFDDAGLTPSTTWHYRVRAVNVDGIAGAYSIPRDVVTAAAPGS